MAWLPGRAGVEEQHSADGVLLAEQRGRPLQRFDGTTLAKATRQLDELAATLARGKTRRPRPKVEAEITKITHDAWVRRVITWQLTGDTPRDLRLRVSVRELRTQLADIGETILIYPAARGWPKARRMLTETTSIRDSSPRSSGCTAKPPPLGHRRQRPRKPASTRQNTLARSMIIGNSG